MAEEPRSRTRGAITDHLPLIRGLVDAFLFLESAGDDEVDPDAAVRCMENMSATLLNSSQADQLALRECLERIADDDSDPTYADFVRAVSDAIGLARDC